MALHYDISKVKNWKRKVARSPHMVELLSMMCFCVGMGEISEKTINEFCYRLNRYSNEVGALAYTAKRRPVKWTYAKLKPWFGMTTNVKTISNSAFDKLVRERSGR